MKTTSLRMTPGTIVCVIAGLAAVAWGLGGLIAMINAEISADRDADFYSELGWLRLVFGFCLAGLAAIPGFRYARVYACDNCGNSVVRDAKICPTCREPFEG